MNMQKWVQKNKALRYLKKEMSGSKKEYQKV